MSGRAKVARKPKIAAPAPAPSGSPQHVTAIFRATALMALAAAASTVSQLTLSPVYGSIPASIWHQKSVMFVALVALINKGTIRRYLPTDASYLIPILAFYAPPVQSILFQYSSQLGPVYGPVVTEALTFCPVLLLSMTSAMALVETLDFSSFNSTIRELIPPIACYTTFTTVEKFVSDHLPAYMGTSQFFTRSGLSFLVAAFSAALSPSKLLLLALPALFHTARLNPHFPGVATTELLNQTLQDHKFMLLERRESLTGYVSVIESVENQFLAMRADHSLLGGEWLVTPERRRTGQTQRETIYTVFTMLEAVRLVETENSNPDAEKKALNIGLGIGTCPSALIAHGINTTIVELDPAVHALATKYFSLPANHTAVLSDAVPFVASTAASAPHSFDYIVHDVFTGGAEPAALFTQSFLEGLKILLKDDGVVAINYAGDLALPTARMVLNTIFSVFPTCRIFRDQLPDPTIQPDGQDFINMVLFCRPQPHHRISFRKPVPADFLGSIVRRRTLYPDPKLEVGFTPDVEAELLTGETVRLLERGHRESAVSHWRIMRKVLPARVWELW